MDKIQDALYEALYEALIETLGGEKFIEAIPIRAKIIDSNVKSGSEFTFTVDCTKIRQMEEVNPDLYYLTFHNGARLSMSGKDGCYYRPEHSNHEFFGYIPCTWISAIIHCLKKRLVLSNDK